MTNPRAREPAKAEALTMDTRRRQVARLHAAGFTVTEMAKQMAEAGYKRVTQPTISRDLAALKKKWADENADAGAQWTAHVQRIDEEIEYWRRRVLLLPSADIEKAAKLYADVVLPLLKERAKLLGLYQPAKVDISGFITNWAMSEGYDPERALAIAADVVASTNF